MILAQEKDPITRCGTAPHHARVVRALLHIFQALGLSSAPYLPKVCTTGLSAETR